MKLGLKIFNKKDYDLIKPLFQDIDFIEVMAIETENYDFLKEFKKDIIIHCMHQGFGINFANPMNFTKNRSALNFAIKLADEFNAKYIVVHAGEKENGFCAEANISHFLKKYDNRILIENSIYKEGKTERYFFDYNNIKKVKEESEKRICLDFEHASQSAMQIGADVFKFVKDLMELKPVYFHICDGDTKKGHLHLGEGILPLNEFKKLIPKDAFVLIETNHDLNKHKKDIIFMRS